MIQQLALSMAIAFALVATRMALFVVVSPFPGPAVPTMVKTGFVLLLAAAVAPVATPWGVAGPGAPTIGPQLILAIFAEAATGASIGFVFRVGMSAAEVLGSSLAHATGLTFASTYDPSQGGSADALSRIVTSAAMLSAFAIGAHRIVIGALVSSLNVIPLGSFPDLGMLMPGTLTWVGRSIDCGLGLALPTMTVSLAVQLALGFVARAAPSLQVFSVGLALMLASGFLVILVGLRDMVTAAAAHTAGVPAVLEQILSSAR